VISKSDLSAFADDIKSVTRAQEVSFASGEETGIEVS
jgi:hypothetical protein